MPPAAVIDRMREAAVSPYREMMAYECLYSLDGMTLKKVSDATVGSGLLPSQALHERFGMVEPPEFDDVRSYVDGKLGKGFGVAVKGTPSWPSGIADSRRPTPIVYFSGDIGLLSTERVAVVGSRKATKDGRARATRLGMELAEAGVTVVSGLAAGIDSAAMRSALNTSVDGGRGRTIGVIGTPIDECYPKQNTELQAYVAAQDLLLSQVPFYRYHVQPFNTKRYYFPERNELMAATSLATVIVEASDTSGTLAQARACLFQRRPLFIMRSCYENHDVEWPRKWAERDGVFILDDVSQVIEAIRM